ncbi:MAG: dipeptide/oligopeptide/nickel ABC transporter ATP-binding protein [Microbacteriaceae bacterium]
MAVAASDLSIQYHGERMLAVNGVSFGVRRGEILAIVGEAGAGKSTLLRALVGQSKAGEAGVPEIVGGDLTVLGVPMRSLRRRKREWLSMAVGFLPQDGGSALTPHLTVGENVAEPIYSRDQKFDRLEAGAAVATLIDGVRLPLGVMGRFPHELSRGQRQRVALAKALILEPELLVADDPTMGVDVMVRGPIFDVIRDLAQERAFSAVVVGHDVRELRRMTDRVAVMQGGVIVGFGGIEQVLRNPHHPYVESLARTLGYR